jgi:Bacterial PH domain
VPVSPASVSPAQARETYRMRMPVIIWWVWLAFAVGNVADLAVQWHHRSSIVIAAILATCTGIAYACALRPKIVADEAGITIRNPVRDCCVPWGNVKAVDIGEAVQVHFSLPGGKEKVYPSWALFSSSRSKARTDLRARRRAAELKGSPSYSRMHSEVRDLMSRSDADIAAMRLDERAQSARKACAPPGKPTLTWAWWPIAAMVVPAIAVVVLILT